MKTSSSKLRHGCRSVRVRFRTELPSLWFWATPGRQYKRILTGGGSRGGGDYRLVAQMQNQHIICTAKLVEVKGYTPLLLARIVSSYTCYCALVVALFYRFWHLRFGRTAVRYRGFVCGVRWICNNDRTATFTSMNINIDIGYNGTNNELLFSVIQKTCNLFSRWRSLFFYFNKRFTSGTCF